MSQTAIGHQSMLHDKLLVERLNGTLTGLQVCEIDSVINLKFVPFIPLTQRTLHWLYKQWLAFNASTIRTFFLLWNEPFQRVFSYSIKIRRLERFSRQTFDWSPHFALQLLQQGLGECRLHFQARNEAWGRWQDEDLPSQSRDNPWDYRKASLRSVRWRRSRRQGILVINIHLFPETIWEKYSLL